MTIQEREVQVKEFGIAGLPMFTGQPVDEDLIRAAHDIIRDEREHGSSLGGWNTPLYSDSRESVAKYAPILGAFVRSLENTMLDSGFEPESVAVANGWLTKRFVDRLNMNYVVNTAGIRFAPHSSLLPVIERAQELEASPAEKLLICHGLGTENVELTRITAPDGRLDIIDSRDRAMEKTFDLLEAERIEGRVSYKVAELHHTSDENSIIRIHKKELRAVARDRTQIARRIAYVAQVAGKIDYMDLDDYYILEILANADTIVKQSEIDYAYRKDNDFVGGIYTNWHR